ncbi:hypothetical protein R1X32_07045 (plasmid) [Rhodococcus opacus]
MEALRVDRQLDEALTHGPDPLHLAVLFGLDETTAIRYSAAARQILQTQPRNTIHRVEHEPKDQFAPNPLSILGFPPKNPQFA